MAHLKTQWFPFPISRRQASGGECRSDDTQNEGISDEVVENKGWPKFSTGISQDVGENNKLICLHPAMLLKVNDPLTQEAVKESALPQRAQTRRGRQNLKNWSKRAMHLWSRWSVLGVTSQSLPLCGTGGSEARRRGTFRKQTQRT